MTRTVIVTACLLFAAGLAGCTAAVDPYYTETPPYDPAITPADFVAGIDHPLLPYMSGATWTWHVYEQVPFEDGTLGAPPDGFVERIEIRVLAEPRDVNGVAATVVQDTVYDAEGAILEDTFDWYGQDQDGNVWYLGEDTCEYRRGACVDTGGSFEWGVDGALPGIIMHAATAPRDAYYQEYYEGEAIDRARDVATGLAITTPAGTFTGVLQTEEWNPLEPGAIEQAYYAPGVGPVLKGVLDGDRFEEVEVLVAYTRP